MLSLIPTSYYISPLSLCPSCLFPVYFHLSHSLAGPLLFIWHPSLLLPLLLCTHFRLTYIFTHKSLFTFILNPPPSYLLLVIKLPVDFCLACRILLHSLKLHGTDEVDSLHLLSSLSKWLCISQEKRLHCSFICLWVTCNISDTTYLILTV